MTTVGEAGERGVLRRVLAQLRPATAASVGPGDDAAVLRLDGELVVTSDTMIEGPDFRLGWHGSAEAGNGFDLGWKLAATNLSDLAAMGAKPVGLTVSIACPRQTGLDLLEGIARGLDAACAELAPGCGVVGGDLGTAPVLVAAVTALGELQGRPPVLRSGARTGDIVAYAGELGLAGLGLALLFRDAADSATDSTADSATDTTADSTAGSTADSVGAARSRALRELRTRHPAAITAQLAPSPPVALGVLAAEAGASSMMDVSDGLSLDSSRLGEASGATIALDSGALLRSFGEQRGESVSLESMLTGGEDHGLLATFPPGATPPPGFETIGEVLDPRPDGARVLLDGLPCEPRGWDPYLVLPPGA